MPHKGDAEISKLDDACGRPWLRGVLVLSCLFFFGMGISPRFAFCSGLLFALMLMGLYLRFAEVFLLGLTCGLMLLLRRVEILISLWPLPTVLALCVALTIGRLLPFTAGAFSWMKEGDLGRREMVLIGAIVPISCIALVLWYCLANPDVSDLAARIARMNPVVLVPAGLLFAVGNAVCEEFVWRGMIFDAVERVFPSISVVILVQGISFGMAHLHGFPRGASGIFLASIYGCMLGYIRHHAHGLLAPVIAHAFADAVIYAVLVFIALRSGG